jgi:hypothetical protein
MRFTFHLHGVPQRHGNGVDISHDSIRCLVWLKLAACQAQRQTPQWAFINPRTKLIMDLTSRLKENILMPRFAMHPDGMGA